MSPRVTELGPSAEKWGFGSKEELGALGLPVGCGSSGEAPEAGAPRWATACLPPTAGLLCVTASESQHASRFLGLVEGATEGVCARPDEKSEAQGCARVYTAWMCVSTCASS